LELKLRVVSIRKFIILLKMRYASKRRKYRFNKGAQLRLKNLLSSLKTYKNAREL